jgi:hypothetical protein
MSARSHPINPEDRMMAASGTSLTELNKRFTEAGMTRQDVELFSSSSSVSFATIMLETLRIAQAKASGDQVDIVRPEAGSWLPVGPFEFIRRSSRDNTLLVRPANYSHLWQAFEVNTHLQWQPVDRWWLEDKSGRTHQIIVRPDRVIVRHRPTQAEAVSVRLYADDKTCVYLTNTLRILRIDSQAVLVERRDNADSDWFVWRGVAKLARHTIPSPEQDISFEVTPTQVEVTYHRGQNLSEIVTVEPTAELWQQPLPDVRIKTSRYSDSPMLDCEVWLPHRDRSDLIIGSPGHGDWKTAPLYPTTPWYEIHSTAYQSRQRPGYTSLEFRRISR